MYEWKIHETVFSITVQRKTGSVSSNIPILACKAWKQHKEHSQNYSDDMGKIMLISVNVCDTKLIMKLVFSHCDT